MIKKSVMQSIISKYYLDINESVKWAVENNQLKIDFTSPSKDLIGNIVYKDFNIEDQELAIFDTKKLNNLLSVLDEDINLNIEFKNNIPLKLIMSDQKFECIYTLADPLLIPRPGEVKEIEWDLVADLSSEDISSMIKAKKALSDTENLEIELESDFDMKYYLLFKFGDTSSYNNKITYKIQTQPCNKIIQMVFNSEYFKSILKANEDSSGAKIYLNSKGLMRLEFTSDLINCNYYMVKKSDVPV